MKILLLDNIRSLVNVGAIFRTCDGAGWDRIILTGFTPTPPRREIAKTAIGAENFIPWEYYEEPTEYVQDLKNKGFHIFSLEQTNRSVDFRLVEPGQYENVCLIVGNEIGGVSQDLIALSDTCVELPMLGRKQSLNVATATGILLYRFL